MIKILNTSILFFLPFSLMAECVVDGVHLSINESIFIKNPELVQEAYEFYLSKKIPKEEAEKLANADDFVGDRLVCREVFDVRNGVLVNTGNAMVLTDLYAEIRSKQK